MALVQMAGTLQPHRRSERDYVHNGCKTARFLRAFRGHACKLNDKLSIFCASGLIWFVCAAVLARTIVFSVMRRVVVAKQKTMDQ